MKEVINGTLPNRKDVLRPAKNQKPTPPPPPLDRLIKEGTNPPKPKTQKIKVPIEVVDVQSEPTLVETMKTISRNGFIKEKSSFSVLHIISFVLLIPAAIVAIPGFLILLLSDYLKED